MVEINFNKHPLQEGIDPWITWIRVVHKPQLDGNTFLFFNNYV